MLPSNNVSASLRNNGMQNQEPQVDNKLSTKILHARSNSTNDFQAFLLVEKDIPTEVSEAESSSLHILEKFQNISNKLATTASNETESNKIVPRPKKISPKIINTKELTHTLGKYWRVDDNNNNAQTPNHKNDETQNNQKKIDKVTMFDEPKSEPSYEPKKINNSIKKINPPKKKIEAPKKIKAKVIKNGELKNSLGPYWNNDITHKYQLNNFKIHDSTNDDNALVIFEESMEDSTEAVEILSSIKRDIWETKADENVEIPPRKKFKDDMHSPTYQKY